MSVLGSQGDAGQFRTPRHIIDFIVSIIDPKKDEAVLDPACGTGGFLISAYKHILATNTGEDGRSTLTLDDRSKLADNFSGYDISPDMVRLSLVNMYLHGFAEPHILEYDTLTSDDRWNEYADVILANPPFMSPKGGIRPHNRFSVQSTRSEVLFVDYMAEHLTANGRAGIIVPEGIIFQGQNAYKQLRKMLVENYLIGVISLPSGVFQPYTGVKTSVLVLDRVVAKGNPNILFSEVKDIGISLGMRQKPTERNDLPQVLGDYGAYYQGRGSSHQSWLIPREQILANDCNLARAQYRSPSLVGGPQLVKVGDVCQMTKGAFSSTTTPPGQYRLILTAAESKSSEEYQFDEPAVCVPLISSTGHGKATLSRIHFGSGRFALANLLVALQPASDDDLDVRFLYHTLDAVRPQIAALMQGAANVSMKPADLARFRIPLPRLEVQQEIVAEIEGYQKVIDGARAVVENYRPHIAVDPTWPTSELGSVCEIIMGQSPPGNTYNTNGQGVPLINGPVEFGPEPFSETSVSQFTTAPTKMCKKGDLILCVRGATTGRMNIAGYNGCIGRGVAAIRSESSQRWINFIINGLRDQIYQLGVGSTFPSITSKNLATLLIPLPELEVQQHIVEGLEAERALVAANHELILCMERNIQATMKRVWGEPVPPRVLADAFVQHSSPRKPTPQ